MAGIIDSINNCLLVIIAGVMITFSMIGAGIFGVLYVTLYSFYLLWIEGVNAVKKLLRRKNVS
jgi:hypothetical protein